VREVRVYSPEIPDVAAEVVRRLQYFANGNKLAVVCGREAFGKHGRSAGTEAVYVYTVASDSACEVFPYSNSEWYGQFLSRTQTPIPVISPDGAFLTFELNSDCYEEPWFGSSGEGNWVEFVDLAKLEEGALLGCRLPSCSRGVSELMFTQDGKELIAVRNIEQNGQFAPDVVRFDMAVLYAPPLRWEEKQNPLTLQKYQFPLYNANWQGGMALPPVERFVAAALSTDGQLLAVGSEQGGVHVADLKKKMVVASFPWEGRAVRDRAAMRVAFGPNAERVVMLANGRLFSRPLGQGKAWQTKSTLGYAHDFAFHPSGNIFCAAFADGQARYLDSRTGAVKQSFRWSKKPKPLYSVAFAPDGLTCAAGGENGRLVIWDVDL
jgi:hypothetical protein